MQKIGTNTFKFQHTGFFCCLCVHDFLAVGLVVLCTKKRESEHVCWCAAVNHWLQTLLLWHFNMKWDQTSGPNAHGFIISRYNTEIVHLRCIKLCCALWSIKMHFWLKLRTKSSIKNDIWLLIFPLVYLELLFNDNMSAQVLHVKEKGF